MLLKQKALTAVALLSLALGIGANTALFSIVDAMLLKMLPVKEPERLVLFKFMAPQDFSVGSYNGSGHKDEATGLQVKTSFPYQAYQRMREQPGPLSDLFAFGSMNFNISADGQADFAVGQAVSGNYYTALGVQMQRQSLFSVIVTGRNASTVIPESPANRSISTTLRSLSSGSVRKGLMERRE
jgi:hypothetical protein